MLDVPDFNTTGEEPPRPPSSGGGLGRMVFVVLLAAAAFFGVRQYTGGAAAVAAADRKAGVKPVLMMFTADWCDPCHQFKTTVLSDDRVVAAVVRSCRFQAVDLTKWQGQPAAVASRYGVDAIPTLLLVNSHGDEFARYNGPFDPQQFARWLESYAP